MFKSVNFYLLRNDEHIALNNDLLYVCEEADPVTLKTETQFNDFKAGNVKLETAYLQHRGSELTKKIVGEDYVRDSYAIGIEMFAESMTHHFNPDFVEAGKQILREFNKYGSSIARKNYNAETTALKDLIDNFKNVPKLQAAVTTLSIPEWFTKLEESNTEFHRLYMIRNDEETDKPDLNLKELRIESVAQYRELVKHLSSHAVITPLAVYDKTIKRFNDLIDKYNGLRR